MKRERQCGNDGEEGREKSSRGEKGAENNTDGIKMKRKQEVERGAWAKKQEELRNSGKETEKDIE